MRILIIEDEYELCESMAEGLRVDGYEVDTCQNGEEGLDILFSAEYDLILLDLNLPGMDGMDILKEFRKENQETPVLILSARIALSDKIQGLDEGANDYLTKPFHFEELEARIRSLTRRKFVQKNTILKADNIEFDTQSRKTTINGQELHLTRKEIGILEYLLLHQG
ncbi:MAG: response regulator transcription factor, partial [Lachnospiraceae bacterium]|nr:response regulator transcription factor [Lachnospiraceae bacterium]